MCNNDNNNNKLLCKPLLCIDICNTTVVQKVTVNRMCHTCIIILSTPGSLYVVCMHMSLNGPISACID